MKRRTQFQKDQDARKALILQPDVSPPPHHSEGLSVGWHYNTYNLNVDRGCSSSIYHSIHNTDKTTTQQPKWFYSTKRLALLAMKMEIEVDHEKRISEINRRLIEDAESEAK